MLVLNAELRERIVSEAILVPEGNGAALMSRVYRMEAESATHMASTGYLPYEDVHGTDNEVRLTVAVRQLAAATATTASGVLELSMVGCVVLAIHNTQLEQAEGSRRGVKVGDVLVRVNGEACTNGAEGERLLEAAFRRAGQSVVLIFAKLPDDFEMPMMPMEGSGDVTTLFNKRIDDGYMRAKVSQMENLRRLYDRTQRGASEANLKNFCAALGIDNKRTAKWMMYAIEVRLRDLKFSRYDTFRPTADDMTVEKDSDEHWVRMQVRSLAPMYPGKWEYLSLKPKEVCASLRAFVEAGGGSGG